MTTIFSNSLKSQNLFSYGISLPTLVDTQIIGVPVSGINPNLMFVGQTEPPLRGVIKGGYAIGLNDTDYNFEFWMEVRSTGQDLITGAPVSLSFVSGYNDAGTPVREPVLTYTWVTGVSVETSGVFNGQFRIIRASDDKILFVDKILLRRYLTI